MCHKAAKTAITWPAGPPRKDSNRKRLAVAGAPLDPLPPATHHINTTEVIGYHHEGVTKYGSGCSRFYICHHMSHLYYVTNLDI